MRFVETPLAGAYILELEPIEDERGFFARAWCARELTDHGLNACVAQCNISYNRLAGTLRGLHYQKAPHAEAKVVRCTRGAIYDVIVDLRRSSRTHAHWFGVELHADLRNALYVPEGLAHGFQTLEDESEVFYQMSTSYVPEVAHGVRWDDPAFRITWPPAATRIISERDRGYEAYRP